MTNVPDQCVKDLAKAIAFAEGFGIKGAVPTRAHNPGDLKIPGTPPELKTGEEGITIFPDDESGWNALYSQLIRIQTSRSHIYRLDMTLSEFSTHWTDTQESSWLSNVIYKLRQEGYDIDKNTTLGDYFNTVV